MALVNNMDAQDIEVAEILLQLRGNFERPFQLRISQNPSATETFSNNRSNMNDLRVTSRPCASLTPNGSHTLQNNCKMEATCDNSPLSNLPPKKRLNLFEKFATEQTRLAVEGSYLAKRDLRKSQEMQTRDLPTQTKKVHSAARRSDDNKTPHEENDISRQQIKIANFTSSNRYPLMSGPSEEVRSVLESERASTSSNEESRIRYQRNAKANNIFCNGSRKAQMKEESVSDDDTEYQADTDGGQKDEEPEKEEFEASGKREKETTQNNVREAMVPIGLGNAQVLSRVLKNIDWNRSYTTVTRKLLNAVFPRSVLATHSLTGKQSPAFPNKPAKRKLNPLLVEDIVRTVADRCNVRETQVRTSITTKCADESKMLRLRSNKKNHRKVSTSSRYNATMLMAVTKSQESQ